MTIQRSRPPFPIRTARHAPLPAYGVWVRLGFIGMSFVAGGLIELQGRDVSLFPALASLLAGGVLAVLSWRGAMTELRAMEATGEKAGPAPRTSGTLPGLRVAARA